MRVVAGVCDEESAVLLITGVRTVVVLVTAGRDGHTGPVMTVVVLLTTGRQVEQHLSSRLSTPCRGLFRGVIRPAILCLIEPIIGPFRAWKPPILML